MTNRDDAERAPDADVRERDEYLADIHEQGRQEGLAEANDHGTRTFNSVIAWLNERDILMPVDCPEGVSHSEVVDALEMHEREICAQTKASEARAASLARELAEVRGMVERLREALRPFTMEYAWQEPDHWPAFGKNAGQGWPTVGDFRRALVALDTEPQ